MLSMLFKISLTLTPQHRFCYRPSINFSYRVLHAYAVRNVRYVSIFFAQL